MEDLIKRFINGLLRTREKFTSKLANLFGSRSQVNAELLTDLENLLLSSDVGVSTTEKILSSLKDNIKKENITQPNDLAEQLKKYLTELLLPCEQQLPTTSNKPFVILVAGVNGAGKTTTIGKLAKMYKAQDKKVMLAAGDTFRAAAIEQLQKWGDANQIPVVAQHQGADSASVVFDAMQAAISRNYDVLIADTAGRLHTQSNLMQELQKIARVIKKLDPEAPHETMLVLDASLGQNSLRQAQEFNSAINLSSITITKLDGTAKGGIIFAIADALNLPIRFLGVGEGIDDLKQFAAIDFVEALFTDVTT